MEKKMPTTKKVLVSKSVPVKKTAKPLPVKAVTVKKPETKKTVPVPAPKVTAKKAETMKKVAVKSASIVASEQKQLEARPSMTPRAKYELVRPSGKKSASARIRFAKEGEQHFSDADLADFRKRLLADRQEILSQLQSTRADALRRPDEENVEEDGSNSFARSADLSRADEQHTRLHAIDDALRAIDKKIYGICQVCGCLIPRDRLRAAPFAVRCVSCKTEFERNVAAAKRAQNL
ncbi:MAG: TraR/DksA C4-type zinc finger protein [Kiritimatiellia bacterium]